MARLTLASVLVLAVLAAACGSDDGAEPSTTSTGAPPADSTTTPVTGQPSTTAAGTTTPGGTTDGPRPAPDVITEELDGAVLVMAVGEERSLQLDSTWAWDEPVLDGAGLELTPVNYLVDPGYFEWIVTAVAPGPVRLTAAGSPNCDDPAQCPPTEVAMTFEIEG